MLEFPFNMPAVYALYLYRLGLELRVLGQIRVSLEQLLEVQQHFLLHFEQSAGLEAWQSVPAKPGMWIGWVC